MAETDVAAIGNMALDISARRDPQKQRYSHMQIVHTL